MSKIYRNIYGEDMALVVTCGVCHTLGTLPTGRVDGTGWANIGPSGYLCPAHNGTLKHEAA